MKKKKFLATIKEELEKIDYKEIDNVLEYYEEIIAERIETGEKEEDIIKSLGSIKNIVKAFGVDKKLEIAAKKPTVSNGFKALIATLSLLSLPLLLPMVIVIAALAFTVVALLASMALVAASMLLAAFVFAIAIFYNVARGIIPISSGLFAFGLVIIIGVISLELGRLLMRSTKAIMLWIIEICHKCVEKVRR